MAEPEDVAVAVPYNSDLDKFLVVKRSEGVETFPGKWQFPSGYIEGEEPENAALRELKEETGLTGQLLKRGEPFTVESEEGDFRVHPFLVMVQDDEIELNSEHTDYRWIQPEELEDMETVKGLRRDLEAVGVLDG